MPGDIHYFPSNGQYWQVPETIYAQYRTDCPNPCRKYHVSSALDGAELVASIVLPFLASRYILHKVVKSRSLLAKQTDGQQAGKFITIYMNANVSQHNGVISALASRLNASRQQGAIQPCPRVPRSRRFRGVFIEQPLDEGLFIYGGYVCDPFE